LTKPEGKGKDIEPPKSYTGGKRNNSGKTLSTGELYKKKNVGNKGTLGGEKKQKKMERGGQTTYTI